MRLVTRKVFAPPGQPAAQSEQQAAASRRQAHHRDLTALIAPNGSEINDPVGTADHIQVVNDHPHNSRSNPANAAALLKQEGAATSAGGVWMLSPGVRMPPPCSGVGLDQRWGWSNDQCPQRNFPLPEPTELPSTTLEHGDEGDGQLCAKRSID